MSVISSSPAFAVYSNDRVRIASIDFVRGLVMIIMALDHVRDYFHADAFLYNPLNLEQTTPAVFLTRWITHFCAPVFVFLAGTSAYLVGEKKGRYQLTRFLLTRGMWLIFLELTVVGFGWSFNILFPLFVLQVIWVLGVAMIILAGLSRLPLALNLVIGLALVGGHNLFDSYHVAGSGADAIGWALLHEFAPFDLGRFVLFVGYPILPWTGIMILGYCIGRWYTTMDATERQKRLVITGFFMIALFSTLRYFNLYGEPSPWAQQDNVAFTILSFLNVSKYPPSLLYVLVTLGPALILLSFTEKLHGVVSNYVISLGRVPMFFYLTHLYLIHALAVVAAVASGFDASDMVVSSWITDAPALRGYGFGLPFVFLMWVIVVALLFPVCLWYDRFKMQRRDQWWWSYL